MSITVEEKYLGRELSADSARRIYIVKGTDDDVQANDALYAEAPKIVNYLAIQSWDVEQIADEIWLGTVNYGLLNVGEPVWNFDTSGGTQHITQSIETMGSYAPAGKTAPDFGGAIGVTHDNVEGVDITVPVYNWSETHQVPESKMTTSYQDTLFRLTGKVNDAPFREFAAGEVLFLGASGSRRGEEMWELTFRFAASANRTGIEVGDITGIEKKGWEYLWVRYVEEDDDTAKAVVKRPIGAYVERVYDEGNFNGLGL